MLVAFMQSACTETFPDRGVGGVRRMLGSVRPVKPSGNRREGRNGPWEKLLFVMRGKYLSISLDWKYVDFEFQAEGRSIGLVGKKNLL